MTDYNETWLQAMDILISKRLSEISFDRTISATIEDASRADEGIYLVSTGNAKFTAYSRDSSYRVNDTVMVTIPEGDYDKQKMIIGKQVKNQNDTPISYRSPFQNFINISNNLIKGFSSNFGMYANGQDNAYKWSEGISDFLQSEAWADYQNNKSSLYSTNESKLWQSDTERKIKVIWDSGELREPIMGYSMLGIQAQFSTWLADYDTAAGNYGVAAVLELRNPDNPSAEPYYTTAIFDSDEFFGDVYNFESFYMQEKVFDISDVAENANITHVTLLAYQRGNFVQADGTPVPTPADNDFSDIGPNIWIKDPFIGFGMSVDDFKGDSATLLCSDNSNYNYDQEQYINTYNDFINENFQLIFKELSLELDRHINEYNNDNISNINYINDLIENTGDELNQIKNNYRSWQEYYGNDLQNDLTQDFIIEVFNKIQIKLKDLKSIIESNQNDRKKIILQWIHSDEKTEYIGVMNTVPVGYEIKWYQYSFNDGAFDPIAGAFWTEIPLDENISSDDDIDINFKRFLEPDLTKSQEKIKVIILKNGSKYLESNELIFNNASFIPDLTSLDYIYGLGIKVEDNGQNGKYFLYRKGNQISPADEAVIQRTLTAVFDINEPYVNNKAQLNSFTKISWYLPKNNTMLNFQINGNDLQRDEILSNQNDIYNIYSWSGENSSTINNNLIKINYTIKSSLNFNYINNTIYLEVIKDGITYTASKDLLFGQRSTSGSPYTVVINFDDKDNNYLNIEEPNQVLSGNVYVIDENQLTVPNDQYSINYSFLYNEKITELEDLKINQKRINPNTFMPCLILQEMRNKVLRFDVDFGWNNIPAGTIVHPKYIPENFPSNGQLYILQRDFPTADLTNEEIYVYDLIEHNYIKLTEDNKDQYNNAIKYSYPGAPQFINTQYYPDWPSFEFVPVNNIIFTELNTEDIVISVDGNITYYWNKTEEEGGKDSPANRPCFIYDPVGQCYILDPYDRYQEGETYYVPIVTNDYEYVKGSGDTILQVNSVENHPNQFVISFDGNDPSSDILAILQVKVTGLTDYDLVENKPVPIYNGKKYYVINGPFTVEYLANGETFYEQSPYTCVGLGDNETVYWKLISNGYKVNDNYDRFGNFKPYLFQYIGSENNKNKAYITLNEENNNFIKPYLLPIKMYIPNLPIFGIQCLKKSNNEVLFVCPIYIHEDTYPSESINAWNGKDLVIDETNAEILATKITAGKKDLHNQFTGVVIGDLGRKPKDIDKHLSTHTGVYGFNQGAMSYCLSDDGTAFFGKDGSGRLYFNGNSGSIYSSQWKGNNPNGMYLDIDDGFIQMQQNNELSSENYNENNDEYIPTEPSYNYFDDDYTEEEDTDEDQTIQQSITNNQQVFEDALALSSTNTNTLYYQTEYTKLNDNEVDISNLNIEDLYYPDFLREEETGYYPNIDKNNDNFYLKSFFTEMFQKKKSFPFNYTFEQNENQQKTIYQFDSTCYLKIPLSKIQEIMFIDDQEYPLFLDMRFVNFSHINYNEYNYSKVDFIKTANNLSNINSAVASYLSILNTGYLFAKNEESSFYIYVQLTANLCQYLKIPYFLSRIETIVSVSEYTSINQHVNILSKINNYMDLLKELFRLRQKPNSSDEYFKYAYFDIDSFDFTTFNKIKNNILLPLLTELNNKENKTNEDKALILALNQIEPVDSRPAKRFNYFLKYNYLILALKNYIFANLSLSTHETYYNYNVPINVFGEETEEINDNNKGYISNGEKFFPEEDNYGNRKDLLTYFEISDNNQGVFSYFNMQQTNPGYEKAEAIGLLMLGEGRYLKDIEDEDNEYERVYNRRGIFVNNQRNIFIRQFDKGPSIQFNAATQSYYWFLRDPSSGNSKGLTDDDKQEFDNILRNFVITQFFNECDLSNFYYRHKHETEAGLEEVQKESTVSTFFPWCVRYLSDTSEVGSWKPLNNRDVICKILPGYYFILDTPHKNTVYLTDGNHYIVNKEIKFSTDDYPSYNFFVFSDQLKPYYDFYETTDDLNNNPQIEDKFWSNNYHLSTGSASSIEWESESNWESINFFPNKTYGGLSDDVSTYVLGTSNLVNFLNNDYTMARGVSESLNDADYNKLCSLGTYNKREPQNIISYICFYNYYYSVNKQPKFKQNGEGLNFESIPVNNQVHTLNTAKIKLNNQLVKNSLNEPHYITISSIENRYPLAIGTSKNINNRNFKVDWNGTVEVNNGIFNGAINASKGTIAGWKIMKNALQSKTGKVTLTSDGSIEAYSGTIGGWDLDQNSLSGYNTILSSNDGIMTTTVTIWDQASEHLGFMGKIRGFDGENATSNIGLQAIAPHNIVLESNTIRLSASSNGQNGVYLNGNIYLNGQIYINGVLFNPNNT